MKLILFIAIHREKYHDIYIIHFINKYYNNIYYYILTSIIILFLKYHVILGLGLPTALQSNVN